MYVANKKIEKIGIDLELVVVAGHFQRFLSRTAVLRFFYIIF
jgi:hypothetical protein